MPASVGMSSSLSQKEPNVQTTFADTIINLSMTGRLIRLELGTAVPVANSEGKQEVRLNPTQTLVMPLEGLVRSFGMQEQLV